ncbi:alanine racemase [Dissulfurispira thermophila]|uniref:Alanine racemase n=2 Tax=root TaxID=1 RepID=A0A7G1H1M3_9BACT|nr:alanine racemase [Dissulfurispira thermophila]BCB96720.1 alanine racemase [Dissulfurispira thermophila]
MNRGAIAEIDLNAVSNNLRIVKKLSNNSPVIAVVKANAYGHGAVEISKRLLSGGVEYLAVAFTGEAKELRNAGITSPILVLFDADIDDVFRYNLIPVIYDRKKATLLSRESERNNRSVEVHIKIDTGMGRLGFAENAVKEIIEIANLKGITIGGIMSHFSEADLMDASFAKVQVNRFNFIKTELLNNGLNVHLFHMANSAAVMTLPESHFDAVRPGLMLYGYSPITSAMDSPTGYQVSDYYLPATGHLLQPVMTVKTKILSLRRLPSGTPISYGRTFITKRSSLIGVVSIGYADGFSRRFSNNAELLVAGRRVPVVGRVCMDLAMIDLTGIEHVDEGDDAVIIGRQGNEFIDAAELARRADTIPYEILTSLGNMAKKIYNN